MTKYILTAFFHSEVDNFSIDLIFYFLRKREERQQASTAAGGGGSEEEGERVS